MDFSNFGNASEKQIEAVLLIIPGPEGKDLTYKEASRELGISKAAFVERIRNFKDKCSEAWDEIKQESKRIEKGDSKSCLTGLIWAYRDGAKKRGLSFELTKEQFRDLTKQDCWYCGAKPIQIMCNNKAKGFYLYNGIDRIENNKGYTEANSLTCCGRCNRMKNVLSAEDFINQIKKIVLNLNLII